MWLLRPSSCSPAALQSGRREETICPTPGLGSCWNTLGLHSFGSQPWWSSRGFQKFLYCWKTYGWARFCVTSLSPYHLPAGPGVPGLAGFTSASPHHWSAVIHRCTSADLRPAPNVKSMSQRRHGLQLNQQQTENELCSSYLSYSKTISGLHYTTD